MSILTSFDNQSKAMISAEDVVAPCGEQLDTCIIMWQNKISQELLELDTEIRKASQMGGFFYYSTNSVLAARTAMVSMRVCL